MSEFRGFGAKAVPFFKALAFHQDKGWFQENRALYEADVVEPMAALIDGLAARFARAGIPLTGEGRKAMFRIHRDTRFAKEKHPYKTHAGAVMTRSGRKDDPGLLYIHLDPEGSFVAAGFYMPEKAELEALRKAILRKPKDYEAMVAALGKGGLELEAMAPLSRMPRGYEDHKDSPVAPALRMKSFIVEEGLKPAEMRRADLLDRIESFAGRSLPLLEFGWKAIG